MYRQGLMARGDYYRGDGLFSFLGKALKTVAPILPLGIGQAASVLGGVISPQRVAVNVARAQQFQNPIGGALPPSPGFSGFQMGGGVAIGTSYAKPGPKRSFGALSPHRKGRRMNVTNVKALRRAGRRVKGFEKLARRFIGFASPKRPKGRMYFRQKKRAS